MIWIVLLIFCFGALLFICAPLYGAPPRQQADDLSDYRAALDEIEDEAERRRFERRILQAAPAAFTQARPARPQRGLTLGIFTFILLLTPVIYLKLGAPELTGRLADAPPPLSPAVAAAASEFRSELRPWSTGFPRGSLIRRRTLRAG
jgi:cytochrome c-type biogenesis protein CcmI